MLSFVLAAFLKYLEPTHKDSLVEATRVFGNLTRDRNVRDFLVKHKSKSDFHIFIIHAECMSVIES